MSVITCTSRLWLFQFPIAVSLMKSSLPNALHFEFLLFLAVLLILLWNYWKGSTGTNCSTRQCHLGAAYWKRKVAWKSRVLLPIWWHLNPNLVNSKSSTFKLLSLFLYSSLLIVTAKLLTCCSFPSNYLRFFSHSYLTETWKHLELASFVAMAIPSREFASLRLHVRVAEWRGRGFSLRAENTEIKKQFRTVCSCIHFFHLCIPHLTAYLA